MEKCRVLRRWCVVLAVRREDVEDLGLFKSRGLVLDSTGDEEGVAGAGFEAAVRMLEDQVSADDVDELLMCMTVASARPAFMHAVADKHHVGAVTHHLTPKTVFGFGHDGVVRVDNGNIVLSHRSPAPEDKLTVARKGLCNL
jgi:hypothetical protein